MLKEKKIRNFLRSYRNRIEEENHSVDDYINLILLLWNASFDYGFESYCINSGIFIAEETSNFPQEVEALFGKAFNEFPDDIELKFWKLYLDDLSNYSECLHRENMLEFLKIKDFYLPYFYLYVQCDHLNDREIKNLKLILEQEKESYKKNYMLSYLGDI